MAELNLNQIIEKLNQEFNGASRKLVFWYDADAEFVNDVDNIVLDNAKVLKLDKDNQFQVKYHLECEDKDGSYLIYAPFAQPGIRENHLADTIRYSKTFSADKTSIICNNLGMDPRYIPVLDKYKKFFNAENRTQKFADLDIESYNKRIIEVGIMSAICKNKTASFEEVVRSIITEDDLEDNKFLKEFETYDVADSFWELCAEHFGFSDASPSLQKLVMGLFATYATKTFRCEPPKAWTQYILFKSGTIIAFLDNLMNNLIYGAKFDALSKKAYELLDAETVLKKFTAEDVLDCNVFAGVDKILFKWIEEHLEKEETDAKLYGKTIPEICNARRKMHFGKDYHSEYFVLENAFHIILSSGYTPINSIEKIAKSYITERNDIDRRYRYFYYYFDKLEDSTPFDALRDLVENIYTNEHLNKGIVNWTECFKDSDGDTKLHKQINFFNDNVFGAKERTVVIISDAMRYEVGVSLFNKFNEDEKSSNVTISAMQSILPSITSFGMAALLPHTSIEVAADESITVDGLPCASLAQRETILKKHVQNAKCVQFDDIKTLKRDDLRDIFNGQDIVYVYHNQIDARGDKANTENEVFNACEEAIEEIYNFVRKLSTSANTYHCIITSDHGFIYKRDKLDASDKIKGVPNASKRYSITDSEVKLEGVSNIELDKVVPGNSGRYYTFPIGSDLFTAPGNGLNYVHGGCSPQEIIIPVIDVKMERGKKDTAPAKIDLVSLTHKITNLITNLDFVQIEPVSDIVKEATYRILFVDEDGESISSEQICAADKKDENTANRMFRLKFSFKNKKYDKFGKYYLIAKDVSTDIEIFRYEVVMDIAMADDFGFGI